MSNINLSDLTYNEVKERCISSLKALGSSKGLKDNTLTKFVDSNVETVTACVYTWYGGLADVNVKWQRRVQSIGNDVFKQIGLAGEISAQLIKQMSRLTVIPEVGSHHQARLVLGALRLPKRCALSNAPWLEAEAKEKFFKMINFNPGFDAKSKDTLKGESLDFVGPYMLSWIVTYWREWAKRLTPPVSIYHLRDIDPFSFPVGAVQDSCTNPVCKYYRTYVFRDIDRTPLEVKLSDPVYGRNAFEEWVRGNGPCPKGSYEFLAGQDKYNVVIAPPVREEARGVVTPEAYYCVQPITVPKQLTSYRVIAMEDAMHSQVQNYISKKTRQWWRSHDLVGFAQDDQDINRRLAILGSKDGSWDTIDSSSASDTIRRSILRMINNPTFDYWLSWMPTHVKWGKTFQRLPIFGTMGSPLTFDNEEVIFKLVGLTAVAMHYLYEYGFIPAFPFLDERVWVVGDDLIVMGGAGKYVYAILRAIGCFPNEEKSFVEGNYRESCGVEAWCGHRVDAPYWPRGLNVQELGQTHWDGFRNEYWNGATALIKLHNELKADWPTAAGRVAEVLSAYHDIDYLSYPGMPEVALDRESTHYQYENTCKGVGAIRERRLSNILTTDPRELPVLQMPKVMRIACEPKATCWCHKMDDSTYRGLERYYKDQYRADHQKQYILPVSDEDISEIVPNGPYETIPDTGRSTSMYVITDVIVTQ